MDYICNIDFVHVQDQLRPWRMALVSLLHPKNSIIYQQDPSKLHFTLTDWMTHTHPCLKEDCKQAVEIVDFPATDVISQQMHQTKCGTLDVDTYRYLKNWYPFQPVLLSQEDLEPPKTCVERAISTSNRLLGGMFDFTCHMDFIHIQGKRQPWRVAFVSTKEPERRLVLQQDPATVQLTVEDMVHNTPTHEEVGQVVDFPGANYISARLDDLKDAWGHICGTEDLQTYRYLVNHYDFGVEMVLPEEVKPKITCLEKAYSQAYRFKGETEIEEKISS